MFGEDLMSFPGRLSGLPLLGSVVCTIETGGNFSSITMYRPNLSHSSVPWVWEMGPGDG